MDAGALSYTTTASGIVLSTPVGQINYRLEMFMCYKYLFETVDIDDDGRICYKEGNYILSRCGLPNVGIIFFPF
jgi:hypothetical protein